MLNKIECGEFSVISVGRTAAIVRGSKVGPLFRNETDAIDWGYDTACGDAIPPEYDIILYAATPRALSLPLWQCHTMGARMTERGVNAIGLCIMLLLMLTL
jgi:hypothetical protein